MAILTEPIGEDSVMPSLGQANLSEGKIPSCTLAEISHISVMSVQPSINVSLVARDKHIIEWREGQAGTQYNALLLPAEVRWFVLSRH